jgi:hypothetical protein
MVRGYRYHPRHRITGPDIRVEVQQAAAEAPEAVRSWPFFDGNLAAMAELTLERRTGLNPPCSRGRLAAFQK